MRIKSLLLAFALSLSLVVPAAAADIPTATEESPVPFSDVVSGAWYAQAAAYCKENGLMSGTGDGSTFSPNNPMTRAMLVMVLYRLAGSPETDGYTGFTDVPSWCSDAVAWAVLANVTSGVGNGQFGSDTLVTREQFVTMLWRSAGSPIPETEAQAFPDDSSISEYARQAAVWARSKGYVSGMEDGSFSPRGTATRAQAAVILSNFHKNASALSSQCAPSGIVALEDGSLMITDTCNKMLWKVSSSAALNTVYAGGETVLDLYGEPLGGYNDDKLMSSYFKEPWAISPFLDGYAVSDAGNNAVRLVRSETVETVNGSTRESLQTSSLGVVFSRPTGLATDENGNLYVSDTLNNAVRKITPKGEVTTVASNLTDPTGLCWKNGVLYIADTGANQIVKVENFSQRTPVIVAGTGEAGHDDGAADAATFNAPQGLVVDDNGVIYVSDTVNGAVRRIKNGKVDTIMSRDWSDQSFYPVSPVGLTVSNGTLYICDNFSRRVLTLSLSDLP